MAASLLFGGLVLQAENETREWRTWTSSEGAQIEAYLKEVLADSIVIVRRDGREFTAPLGRFAEEDRAYVAEWMRRQLPSVEEFRALDFMDVDVPQSYEIEGVPHVRARGRDPLELAAVKMVLEFHGISYSESLDERIQVREGDREQAIPPRDLANVLGDFPLSAEPVQGLTPDDNQQAEASLNAIRKAISLDLPVIVAHRPLIAEDTPEVVVVATGYDRRSLRVLDPAGGRQTAWLDLRELEESLVHALVVFPRVELPALEPEGKRAPPTEFLSRVSAAIREASASDATALGEFFQEKGIRATVRDINRSDFRGQQGSTRSFARQGGIPEIELALDRGAVVVIPQEFEAGGGFALIYGQKEDEFAAVEFFPNGTFRRGAIPAADLASRWLTRENRNYRLDLIQIEAPPAPPATPPPPPRQDPPGRPPQPPR